jgi:hypothetical protein
VKLTTPTRAQDCTRRNVSRFCILNIDRERYEAVQRVVRGRSEPRDRELESKLLVKRVVAE